MYGEKSTKDILITDFETSSFRLAFVSYFEELGIHVNDWDGLFEEMNTDGDNFAYLRTNEDDEVIGFIQFCCMNLESSFFKEKCGFIREFWIDGRFRKYGHGSKLLHLTEEWFKEHDVSRIMLTTDTAAEFYRNRGYKRTLNVIALNEMDVYVKEL